MTRAGALRRAPAAGFTLIELLAVIVIISILAYFLLVNVTAAKASTQMNVTIARMKQIAAAIGEYTDATGDAPPSTFPPEWGPAADSINLGGEALYLALCAEGQAGAGRLDEDPINTDRDQAAQRIPGHSSLELFEFADDWGNPIAYFQHKDYERKDEYLCFDQAANEERQSTAVPRRNKKTGRWLGPHSFQLISAGPNGHFDTPGDEGDDDIVHSGGS